MFVLPDTFKENNEDYIVMDSMRSFIRCRPEIKGRLSDNRGGLLKTIVEYANESELAEEDTSNWVDSVIREGIKDLYVRGLTQESVDAVQDVDKIYELIEKELARANSNHICNNVYTEELSLVRFQVENNRTLIYTFYLCHMVYIYDGEREEKKRLYPICVDIYPEEGLIVGRGKPRQNMYKYDPEGFDPKTAQKIQAEYRILKAIKYISDKLGITYKHTDEMCGYFKNCLYKLLDNYTQTPPEIISLIKSSEKEIDAVIDIVSDNICTKGSKMDIASDIMNLIEKYFSITYEDKSIFVKGKEAYPLRIAATDEEESKVDQKSAREHPLQSKAIFFDNKMMQKNQMCDGVVFKFKRKNIIGNEEFKVRINVKNDYCHLKFFEYTEEVDIQNVLRLFINP